MNKAALLSSITCALALPALAHAGGLFVPGYGSQAQPRAGAFLAKADDPTALFHNPAGLAKAVGTIVHVGINMLDFDQSFERAGTYEATGENLPYEGQPYAKVEDVSSPNIGIGGFQAVPFVAVSTDLGLDLPLRVAAGVFAGHGYPERLYTPDYQQEADPSQPPPPQRYDILSQESVAVFPSLGAAYRITDQLDVGARVSWGIAQLKGRRSLWAARNYSEWEGYDGVFTIDATDTFVPAWSLGVLYRPTDSFELGATYRSQQSVHAKGDGQATLGSGAAELGITALDPILENTRCAPGGTVVNYKSCADLVLPRVAGIGGRWIWRDGTGRERADVELNVMWEDWSAAKDVVVTVDARSPLGALHPVKLAHGYKDVWSVRLGGSYTQPVGDNLLVFRAGAAHDTETAPESWTRLDIDAFPRTTLGLGVGFETSSFRVDVGGGAVLEGERVVENGCNPTNTEPGCSGTGEETPVDERDAPDPAQPTANPALQVQSPFNDGTYEQSYVLLSVGFTAWF